MLREEYATVFTSLDDVVHNISHSNKKRSIFKLSILTFPGDYVHANF